jgi:hypothetical protein
MAAAVSPSEKQAALEAALTSETFARSEQLRSFLRLVCEMEMAGRAGELTEYLIGVEALGRPEGYSPVEDSAVRTRAYELRQRLKRLYEAELPETSVRIELPKGSYVPRFVSASREAAKPAAAAGTAPTGAKLHKRSLVLGAVAGLAIGLTSAALVGWLLAISPSTGAPVDPAVRQAWSPLLGKDPEVVVSVAAPLHLLVSPYMAVTPTNLVKYPVPKEVYPLFGRYRPLAPDATLEMQPVQKAIQMGDVQALAQVVGVLRSLGGSVRVLPETNSPLAALRRRSAVLLGSPWYSRSASVLLAQTPWTMAVDPETKEIGLFGRGPDAGRKFLPQHGLRGEYQGVFGLVTVLPSDEHADDGRTFVIFSGLTSVGTHGAAAFFASASSMRQLMARLKQEGYERLPRSYQVVVRCRASDDALLIGYSYETHRVIAR